MINCVSIFFGEHLQKELNKDESGRVEQFARYDNIGVSQSGGVTLNPRLNPCVSIHFNMSSNTVCILPFKTVNPWNVSINNLQTFIVQCWFEEKSAQILYIRN